MAKKFDQLFSKKERYLKEILESNCIYVKDLNHWVGTNYIARLKLKKELLKVTPKLLINKTRSKSSRCRVCGFAIEKDKLRIGYPTKDPRGDYGYISCWVHIECSKKILYSCLYFKENENILKGYLHDYKNNNDYEENYNKYEIYIYNNLQWDLFFGGIENINEEELCKLKEISRPYELKKNDLKCSSSFEMLINEENEKINSLNYLNIEKKITNYKFSVPKELKYDLLEYQKEGISWMINQEKSNVKGGILADEMGMGKTIQAITLILCQKLNTLNEKKVEPQNNVNVEYDHKKEEEETMIMMKEEHQKINPMLHCDIYKENMTSFKETDIEYKKSVKGLYIKKSTTYNSNNRSYCNNSSSNDLKIKEESECCSVILIESDETQNEKINDKKNVIEENDLVAQNVLNEKKIKNIKRESVHKNNNILSCNKKNDFVNKLQGQTLIIAPVAAVMQWKSEIEKFIDANILSVYVYHGNSKMISHEELIKYDIVITSYAVVEVNFRKIVNKHKQPCEYCGRLYLPNNLDIHKKYFCGPTAVRTEKLKKRKKKNKDTALVAMKKFDETFVPTPRNVLLEIMANSKKELEHNDDIKKDNEIFDKTINDNNSNNNQNGNYQNKGKNNISKKKKKINNQIKTINTQKDGNIDVIVLSSDSSKEKSSSSSSSKNSVYSPLSRKTSSRIIDLSNLGFDKETMEDVIERLSEGKKKKKNIKNHRDVKWNVVIKNMLENFLYNIDMNDKCKHVLIKIYLTTTIIENTELEKLNVGELKVLLITMGKHIFGTKIELINRILVSAKYIRKELYDNNTDQERKDKSCIDNMDGDTDIDVTNKKANNKICKERKIKKEDEKCSIEKKRKTVNIKREVTINKKRRNTTDGGCTLKGKGRKSENNTNDVIGDNNNNNSCCSNEESYRNNSSDESYRVDLCSKKKEPKNKKKIEKNGRSQRRSSRKSSCKSSFKSSLESEMKEESSNSLSRDDYDNSSNSFDSYDSIIVRKSKMSKEKKKRENMKIFDESALHQIYWNRIILDEAHRIKNRNTSTTQSILNLKCCGYRWCLTGTPLQNRISELYSLIRFIEFYPYAYYFCSKRDCRCVLLNYEMRDNKYCYFCNHSRINHFNYFNKRILKPIQSFGYKGEGLSGMCYLKNEVLDKILLRRTKGERKSDIKLKPLIIKIRKDRLTDEEKDFYESLYKQTSTQFNTYVNSNTVLHNYAHIFDLLSRLRQAADHPYLIIFGNTFLSDPSGKFIKKNTTIIPAISNDYVCGICLENVDKRNNISTRCNHNFHKSCLKQYIESFEMDSGLHEEEERSDSEFKNGNIIKYNSYNIDTNESMNMVRHTNSCKYDIVMNDNMDDNMNENMNDNMNENMNDNMNNNMNDNKDILKNKRKNLEKRSKSISVVKFKNKDGYINLLSNDENIKNYPLGCPVCFIPLTVDFNLLVDKEENEEDEIIICKEETTYINKSFINRINTQEYKSSTKIEAVYEEVKNVIDNTDDKCLIFSQYCSMLDLIEYHLKKNNIVCSKLLGYMSMISRNNILYNFNQDKQLRVLLISLKAGGEGLNLQVANRIFIVDPWWNPAAELQAIQRAHRIGQTKTVYAIRFIIENTVEEKIIQLQNKKQLVFDSTIGDSGNAMQKLSKEDLAFLFHS
ncbi:DNA repair protein rhp16, putative [Plasmodium sp. DRC-Itaito]|nr:DNA repair protein rhp16, putative [Plasmodium sp. DRC-Itaito]